MRYMRAEDHERCGFDPEQGFVILTEADFTSIFGFPAKHPPTPRLSDVRQLWVGLAVNGQLPRHMEAAVKVLVETDDDWAAAYARVNDLPLPGEDADDLDGLDDDDDGGDFGGNSDDDRAIGDDEDDLR